MPRSNFNKAGDQKTQKSADNMVSMISKTTMPQEFEAKWKNNPDYKVEMLGTLSDFSFRSTALHQAADKSNLEMVKYFLKILDSKYIDSLDAVGESPLMQAIHQMYTKNGRKEKYQKKLEIIRLLLNAGADVNFASQSTACGFNRSPLTHALKILDPTLVTLLMQFGAQRFYAFSPDKKALIKQQFTDEEYKMYKRAKNEIKMKKGSSNLFILGREKDYVLSSFPPKVVAKLLLNGRVVSPNKVRVIEAKKNIKENLRKEKAAEEIKLSQKSLILYHGETLSLI